MQMHWSTWDFPGDTRAWLSLMPRIVLPDESRPHSLVAKRWATSSKSEMPQHRQLVSEVQANYSEFSWLKPPILGAPRFQPVLEALIETSKVWVGTKKEMPLVALTEWYHHWISMVNDVSR